MLLACSCSYLRTRPCIFMALTSVVAAAGSQRLLTRDALPQRALSSESKLGIIFFREIINLNIYARSTFFTFLNKTVFQSFLDQQKKSLPRETPVMDISFFAFIWKHPRTFLNVSKTFQPICFIQCIIFDKKSNCKFGSF